MVTASDGQLVDTIAVHLLEGSPQLGIRSNTFRSFQGKHDLSDARCRPFRTRHFPDPLQSHQANGVTSAIDEKTALPATENVLVYQRLNRQIGWNGGAMSAHGLRDFMAYQQALIHRLVHL